MSLRPFFRPSSLRAFLVSARNHLQSSIRQNTPITLVFGNESCDLDSVTSALLYAYLHASTLPPSQLPVPVLNIPRADLHLRPELLHLLPHANIEPHHLLTADDLPTLPNSTPDHPRYPFAPHVSAILTDHNAPAGPLAPLAHHITAVIDHHADEHTVPASARPRLIQPAASCTSLVLTHLQPAWDALTTSATTITPTAQSDTTPTPDALPVRRTWNAQLAKLALASILTDSANLTNPSKTTPADRTAARYLTATIAAADPTFAPDPFYRALSAAKADVSHLPVRDLLRKDLKRWGALAIASMPADVAGLARHAATADGTTLPAVLAAFRRANGLDDVVLMTAYMDADGAFAREIAVLGPLAARVEAEAGKALGLEAWRGDAELGEVRVWRQADVAMSRKQVAPLLREMVE